MTLEDILEEIVGEFTTDPATVTHKDVHVERPGVFIVNASATIRALNRALGWQLPTGGPKTRQRPAARASRDHSGPRHHGARRGLRVRSAADGGQRRSARCGCAPRRLSCRAAANAASSASATRSTGRSTSAAGRLARGVVARHDREPEPLRLRFPQPLVAVGHGAHLAGEAELAEGDELRGQRHDRAGSTRAPAPPAGPRRSRRFRCRRRRSRTRRAPGARVPRAGSRPPAAWPGGWRRVPARYAAARRSASGRRAPAAR